MRTERTGKNNNNRPQLRLGVCGEFVFFVCGQPKTINPKIIQSTTMYFDGTTIHQTQLIHNAWLRATLDANHENTEATACTTWTRYKPVKAERGYWIHRDWDVSRRITSQQNTPVSHRRKTNEEKVERAGQNYVMRIVASDQSFHSVRLFVRCAHNIDYNGFSSLIFWPKRLSNVLERQQRAC